MSHNMLVIMLVIIGILVALDDRLLGRFLPDPPSNSKEDS